MKSTNAPTRPLFRAPAVIFWVALALRVASITIGRTYHIRVPIDHFGFGWEMGRIARSLYRGQGFANPFNGISGPTAWTPPLYPLLMAVAFRMFGLYTNAAAFFLLAVNSVFSALVCPALYELAARTFDAYGLARRGSKYAAPVALWSAWIWAAYPAFLQYAIHWLWEMSLTCCLFTWMLVFALRLRRVGETGPRAQVSGLSVTNDLSSRPQRSGAERPAVRRDENRGFLRSAGQYGRPAPAEMTMYWLVYGALWALITLSNASLLVCLPFVSAWILWPTLRHVWLGEKQIPPLGYGMENEARTGTDESPQVDAIHQHSAVLQHGVLRSLVGPVAAALVFCAVMAPWWVRNERVFHTFIPTRGEFGIELYQSQLPSHSSFPWGTSLPLFWGSPEFVEYKQMGEVAYNRMLGERGKAMLRAHPGYALHRSMDLFFFFWDGTPHPPDRHPMAEYFRNFSYALISVCGLLGCALAAQRRAPAWGLWLSLFVVLPLPYYFITPGPRFRHPLEPVIVMLGVYLFRSADRRRATAE